MEWEEELPGAGKSRDSSRMGAGWKSSGNWCRILHSLLNREERLDLLSNYRSIDQLIGLIGFKCRVPTLTVTLVLTLAVFVLL